MRVIYRMVRERNENVLRVTSGVTPAFLARWRRAALQAWPRSCPGWQRLAAGGAATARWRERRRTSLRVAEAIFECTLKGL